MGELVFVGMGLHDERDISLRGMEEIQSADAVFAELYTSLMENSTVKKLSRLAGKRVVQISRRMLEEENGQELIAVAQRGKAVMLVPGDPMIATTHVDLRIRARRAGLTTRIVHGASIMSAAVGLSGLQNYKFGRSVTIPFGNGGMASETPYNVIGSNRDLGLHTLCFLDIRVEEKRYMTIHEALSTLLAVERKRQESAITPATIVVGIARAGSKNPTVKAGSLNELLSYDFGRPPYTLVFPGKLHFMEAEALIELADAPETVRKMVE